MVKKFKKIMLSVLSVFVLTVGATGCTTDDAEIEANQSHEVSKAVNSANQFDPKEIIRGIEDDFGIKFDYDQNVNPEDAIVFNSEREFREFIRTIEGQKNGEVRLPISSEPSDNNTTYGCPDGIYSGSVLTWGFASLYYEMVISGGKITSVTGYISGLTLGAVSYTHLSTRISGQSASVTGLLNYIFFFEGIGTVYSQHVSYNLVPGC